MKPVGTNIHMMASKVSEAKLIRPILWHIQEAGFAPVQYLGLEIAQNDVDE